MSYSTMEASSSSTVIDLSYVFPEERGVVGGGEKDSVTL